MMFHFTVFFWDSDEHTHSDKFCKNQQVTTVGLIDFMTAFDSINMEALLTDAVQPNLLNLVGGNNKTTCVYITALCYESQTYPLIAGVRQDCPLFLNGIAQ